MFQSSQCLDDGAMYNTEKTRKERKKSRKEGHSLVLPVLSTKKQEEIQTKMSVALKGCGG